MRNHDHTIRLAAGTCFALLCLLGTAISLQAQTTNWTFESGATDGWILRSRNIAPPAPNDSTVAGDESVTGARLLTGLPVAGSAWSVGNFNQYNGQIRTVPINGIVDPSDTNLMTYTAAFPAGLNARGQTNYLNTYALNQHGDLLHMQTNDQIAKSPTVTLPANAVVGVWAYGGGGSNTPALDNPGEEYIDGSTGLAVRRSSDNALLAGVRIQNGATLRQNAVNLAAFAGEQVYFEVVDAFQGSFGWLAVDEILITQNSLNLPPIAFTFEAEDFNFDNGQYIANPNLTKGDANCYYLKGSGSGVEGVDFHELNPTVHFGIDGTEWRFDGFNAFANLPQTTNSFDVVRSQYTTAGVADYDMANNAVGEWWNYTRSFPNTNGYLYVRVAADGPFTIRLDEAINPTQTNQTLTTRGWFMGTGTSKALYQTVPLTDITGTNPVVVAFNGSPKTLRMTALTAGFNANFYILAPTSDPENLIPTVSITQPENLALLPSGDPVTNVVTVADADSPVGSHIVQLLVDGVVVGQDSASPYSLIISSVPDGGHTLTAWAVDPDGMVGVSQNVLIHVGPEAHLYQETYTIANGLTGDKSPNNFGWQPFGANGNVRTDNWVNYAASNKTANAVNTLSAGPHFDGTFNLAGNPSSHGIQFVNTETVALTFTPEFSFDPATYGNKIKFSWEQGNRLTGATCQLIIRVGSTWYAHYQTFANSVEVNPINAFGTLAELKEVIYDPNPTNWLALNFDGTYDHVSKLATASTLGAATLGGNPGAPLSGTITAFGLYLANGSDGNQNRRFDTFTIDVIAPETVIITGFSLNGDQLTLSWSGGTGPFKVQKKTLITDGWADEMTGINDTNTTVTISLQGGNSGYYQVVGQ